MLALWLVACDGSGHACELARIQLAKGEYDRAEACLADAQAGRVGWIPTEDGGYAAIALPRALPSLERLELTPATGLDRVPGQLPLADDLPLQQQLLEQLRHLED